MRTALRSLVARSGGPLLAASLALLAACAPFDLSVDRPYPCSPEGSPGQCAEHSRCGLEGYCHVIGTAAAYACASSADCEAGWHCGVAHVCYDRTTAGALPCRLGQPAAEDDCATGWRCGLELVCHDRSVGAAYACNADPDCEQGWRCGPDGHCLSGAEDALTPATAPQALQVSQLSPAQSGLPLLVAVDDQRSNTGGYPNVNVATADPGGLSLVWSNFVTVGLNSEFHAQRTPLPGPPGALAVVSGRAFALVDGGLVEAPIGAGDAGLRPIAFPSFPAGQLRSTEDLGRFADLLAFQGSTLAQYPLELDGGSAAYPLTDRLGQPLQILDVAAVPAQYPLLDTWLVSTPRGLYAIQRSGVDFVDENSQTAVTPFVVPVAFAGYPNLDCDGGAPPVAPRRLHSRFGFDDSVTLDVSPTPATPRVALLNHVPIAGLQRCGPDGLSLALETAACPEGGSLVEFTSRAPDVFTRCRVAVDGGFEERTYAQHVDPSDGGVQRGPVPTSSTTNLPPTQVVSLPAVSGNDPIGFADEEGHVTSCPGMACTDVVLTVAPTLLIGTARGDLVARFTPGAGNALANQAYTFVPGVGFTEVLAGGQDSTCAAVAGASTWKVNCPLAATGGFNPGGGLQVVQVSSDGGTRAIATLSDSSQVPALPAPGQPGDVFSAALAAEPDGGRELLVAAFDKVWAGDATAQGTPGAPVATLDVKFSPLPGSRITSLTAGTQGLDGGSNLLEGYLLTSERLFQFAAQTQTRWRATEVEIPAGDPLAVWRTARRGRVGYLDGTVYSLPSRIQIAEPLRADQRPVRAYAAQCSSAFALGAHGVFSLQGNPDGGPQGVWQQVPVPMLQGASADHGWSDARLFTTDEEVLLINGHGTTLRIGDPACDGGS